MASTEVDMNECESVYHVLNELHATHRCCRHENILGCRCTVQNHKILVTFESAKSLSSFSLFQQGCKKENYVSYIIGGTLGALGCIHSLGNRVHGNINLNTVFLDKDYVVKLGFPSRTSNPDLVDIKKKYIDLDMMRIDFRMVGELACTLYHGESREKKLGWLRSMSLLPKSLQDFVKLCVDPSCAPTMNDLIRQEFLKVYNTNAGYKEVMKMLRKIRILEKK